MALKLLRELLSHVFNGAPSKPGTSDWGDEAAHRPVDLDPELEEQLRALWPDEPPHDTPRGRSDMSLGRVLVQEKAISLADLRLAREIALKTYRPLHHALTSLAIITDTKIVEVLSAHYHVPCTDLGNIEHLGEVRKLVPRDVVTKYQVMPVARAGRTIIFAGAGQPPDRHTIDDLKFVTGFDVEYVLAPEAVLVSAIDRYYGDEGSRRDDDLDEHDEDEAADPEEEEELVSVLELEEERTARLGVRRADFASDTPSFPPRRRTRPTRH